MIRQLPKIALLIGALTVAGQASAYGHGGGPGVLGAVLGGAVVGAVVTSALAPREVVVQQPVYAAPPPPVYVAPPQPVYYAPQPVVYAQPGYYAPPPPPHYYYGRPGW